MGRGDRQRARRRPRHPELIAPAVATLRALPLTKEKAGDLPGRSLRIAGDSKNPAELRSRPWPPCRVALVNPDQPIFDFLIAELDREQPVRSERPRPTCWREPSSQPSSLSGLPMPCEPPDRSRSTGCWSLSSSRPTASGLSSSKP